MALCIAYHTAQFVFSVTQLSRCDNLVSRYDQLCLITQRVTLAMSVLNVFTDLYILLLPISPILALNITKGKRYGVLLIFLSGSA